MFLADAVAAYVTTLTERELDAPLIALLRSHGFTHVHLVHGQYEFGKDIIARRVEDGAETQYCIQSKASDLTVRLWREVRLQVDAMRTGTVAHPDFDPTLPRRLVVATNGRLVGGAAIEFQDYNTHHADRGEATAKLWDIDHLAPMFYDVLIDGVSARHRSRTLELLGQLSSGRGSLLRGYVAQWYGADLTARDRWAKVLTGAMLARHAIDAGREDLAIQLACHLIRSTWEVSDVPDAESQRRVARALIADVARRTWQQFRELTPDDVVACTLSASSAFSAFVTHPVKIARVCEALSMGGLLSVLDADAFWMSNDRDVNDFKPSEVAEWIHALTKETPGVSHPVSDDHAFSLLATCLFLDWAGHEVTGLLTEAAIWTLDRVEFASGLAEAGAAPNDVVLQLLGSPYPKLRKADRNDSYTLTVIIDLAKTLGLAGLFEDLVHDLDAVDAYATIVRGYPPGSATLVARLSYTPSAENPSRPVAAHYADDLDVMSAATAGAWFDVLVTWATLRDRHTPAILDALHRELARDTDSGDLPDEGQLD